jgi:hypothetical protein
LSALLPHVRQQAVKRAAVRRRQRRLLEMPSSAPVGEAANMTGEAREGAGRGC